MRAVPCLLAFLCLAVPAAAGDYSRALYPHWADADRDCQDTRQEVLIARSLAPVLLDARGCRVLFGLWRDAYSGRAYSSPLLLDLDHVVPLAEAHRSGAAQWSRARRAAFANDPANLLITSRALNRAKGDDDPARWMPPAPGLRCIYARRWLAIKSRWQLAMDRAEARALRIILARCP